MVGNETLKTLQTRGAGRSLVWGGFEGFHCKCTGPWGQQAAPWSLSSRQTGLGADPVQGSSPALCICGKRTGVQDGAGCCVAELRPVSTRGHGALPHEGSRVHQLIETHVRVCMFPRGGNIWKAIHQTVNGVVLMGGVKGLGWG